jgi:hypothetical protein
MSEAIEGEGGAVAIWIEIVAIGAKLAIASLYLYAVGIIQVGSAGRINDAFPFI